MKIIAILLLFGSVILNGQTPTPSSTSTPTSTPTPTATPTPSPYPFTLNWYALPPNYGVTSYEIGRFTATGYVHYVYVSATTTVFSGNISGVQLWAVRGITPTGPTPWSNQGVSPPHGSPPERLEVTSP